MIVRTSRRSRDLHRFLSETGGKRNRQRTLRRGSAQRARIALPRRLSSSRCRMFFKRSTGSAIFLWGAIPCVRSMPLRTSRIIGWRSVTTGRAICAAARSRRRSDDGRNLQSGGEILQVQRDDLRLGRERPSAVGSGEHLKVVPIVSVARRVDQAERSLRA